MRKKRLPNSLRKYIRQEKARIRRQFLDLEEQKRQIAELYKKAIPYRGIKDERTQYPVTRNL